MTISHITGESIPALGYFAQSPSGSIPYYKDDFFSFISCSETPGYNAKMKARQLIPITVMERFERDSSTSGSRTYTSWNAPSGGSLITSFSQSMANKNSFAVSPYLSVTDCSSQVDGGRLDSEVTRAILGLTQSIHDTATFAAEFHKTLRMFIGLKKRFIKAFLSRSPNQWASIWLEGRYGWRTLAYDLQSVGKAMDGLYNRSEFFKKTVGSSALITDVVLQDAPFNLGTVHNVITTSYDVSFRGFAITKTKTPSFGGSVVTTAWELLPLSFVLDWFVDVGSKLSYISQIPFLPELVSGYGYKVTATKTISTTWSPIAGGRAYIGGVWYQLDSNVASSTSTATYKIRKPHTPNIIPNLRLNLDGYKISDLVALIKVFYDGKKIANLHGSRL